jgi:adenosylmethionine-8-amino-7-oxononanoate aminotransferase
VLRDEPVLERNRALTAHLARRIAPLKDHPHVADVRQTGMIAAIELVQDKATRAPFPTAERRGLRVYRHGLENEMLLRPLGNVVYFMPPFCITEEEIDRMVAVAIEGIERAVV